MDETPTERSTARLMEAGTQNTFHAIVKGKVQGVGYRVFAMQSARQNGVAGWVRNRPDGTVEVHAEADELILTEFLTDLYRGPIMGHVQDIEITWSVTEHTHSGFEIRR